METLRPEDRLLVCIAQLSLNDSAAEQICKLLKTNLDWDYLRFKADQHCILPLLSHHLNSLCPDAVPPPVAVQLQSDARKNSEASFFLTGELLKLMALLEAHDIRAIPFKGPTLALAAYGDIALRQFGDLDILVHPHDVLKVKELLFREGFKPTPELTGVQEAALLRFDCAYNFSNDKGVLFDVHWSFAAPYFSFQVDLDGLWKRLEAITVARQQLLTISVEDLFLVLCLHGITHSWERLGWICDVAGLINRRSDIDWKLVTDIADRCGCRRILSLGIMLASDLLEARVPSEVLQSARQDAVVSQLAVQLQAQLFATEHSPGGILDQMLMQLRMRERTRDKLKSGVRLAVTPRVYDWMPVTLPRWLFFLYYPLRPLRLAGKYGARLLGRSNP